MLYNFALLLPSSVSLIFSFILALRYKENTKSQNILSFCLLFTSISLLIFVNSFNIENYSTYIILDVIDSFTCPLVFPMMYLYFKSITDEKPFNWLDYMLFAPSIIIGSSTLILYLIMGEDNAIRYITYHIANQPFPSEFNHYIYTLHSLIGIKLYNWVMLIQTILIGVYAIYNVYRYHSRLKDFYSNLDDKSIRLDNKLLMYFLLSGIMAVILAITGRAFWAEHPNYSIVFFAIGGLVSFGLAYNGTLQRYSAIKLANDIEQADIEDENQVEAPIMIEDGDGRAAKFVRGDKYQKMVITLTKLMNEDKMFLNSDLRLDQVARLMSTNRNYVSKLIKEEYNCSFSDYINGKRVEFSKILMHSNPNLRQDELALQSGFTNAQSFSRTFKQIVGTPPKEWYKNALFESQF